MPTNRKVGRTVKMTFSASSSLVRVKAGRGAAGAKLCAAAGQSARASSVRCSAPRGSATRVSSVATRVSSLSVGAPQVVQKRKCAGMSAPQLPQYISLLLLVGRARRAHGVEQCDRLIREIDEAARAQVLRFGLHVCALRLRWQK